MVITKDHIMQAEVLNITVGQLLEIKDMPVLTEEEIKRKYVHVPLMQFIHSRWEVLDLVWMDQRLAPDIFPFISDSLRGDTGSIRGVVQQRS